MTAAPALELELVGLVVDRLRTELTGVPTIAPVLEIGQALQNVPAVLALLVADEATESAAPQVGAIQRITATLAVVHVVAVRNAPRGGPAIDPLAALAGRTRALLNGWKPAQSPRRDSLQLRRGRVLALEAGRASWQDEYAISWRARSVADD